MLGSLVQGRLLVLIRLLRLVKQRGGLTYNDFLALPGHSESSVWQRSESRPF